jgi:hypothetical protein
MTQIGAFVFVFVSQGGQGKYNRVAGVIVFYFAKRKFSLNCEIHKPSYNFYQCSGALTTKSKLKMS